MVIDILPQKLRNLVQYNKIHNKIGWISRTNFSIKRQTNVCFSKNNQKLPFKEYVVLDFHRMDILSSHILSGAQFHSY